MVVPVHELAPAGVPFPATAPAPGCAAAWTLRHGVSEGDLMRGLITAYRHRDEEWRAGVMDDARERNRARALKRVNA